MYCICSPQSPMEPGIEISPQQEALFNELFQGEGSQDAAAEFEETMKRLLQQGQQATQGTGQSGRSQRLLKQLGHGGSTRGAICVLTCIAETGRCLFIPIDS